MGYLLSFFIMFGFWVLLSGYFDLFHIVSGIVSSLVVALISGHLLIGRNTDIGLESRRVIRFLRYLPWLVFEIAKSNVDVARRTLQPRASIDPRVFEITTDIKEQMGLVTLANSITLTPGTVTIEARGDGVLLVHALAGEHEEALKSGLMARKVKEIEVGRGV